MKPIDKNEIINLFLNKGMKVSEMVKAGLASQTYINRILRENNIKLRKDDRNTHFVNMDFIKDKTTEEYLYFLGLFMADGYLNEKKWFMSIDLMRGDNEILEILSKYIYLGDTYKIKEYKTYKNQSGGYSSKDSTKWRLQINSEEFCKDFFNVGVEQGKSFTLKWPKIDIEDDKLRHFIRGMIDGDGCLSKFKKSDSFCVHLISSVPFCESAKEKLSKIGFNFKIKYMKEFSKPMASLWLFGCANCEKFLDWLYFDSKIFLKRKYEKYLNLKKDRNHKRLKLKRKGYVLDKRCGLYRVTIKKNKKILFSKHFRDEQSAAEYYREKNRELLELGII